MQHWRVCNKLFQKYFHRNGLENTKKLHFQSHIYTDVFCHLLGWMVPQAYYFTRTLWRKWKPTHFYLKGTFLQEFSPCFNIFESYISYISCIVMAVLKEKGCLFNIYLFLTVVVLCGMQEWHVSNNSWSLFRTKMVVQLRTLRNIWSLTRTKQDVFERLQCLWSNEMRYLLSPFYSLIQISSWYNLGRASLRSVELCQFTLLK